jgi:2-iminobutanoate/2-iminopropanoate deaminase
LATVRWCWPTQVAVDDAGEVVVSGDAGALAIRIFEIIGGVLAAHGATLADFLHIRTLMTSLDDLPAYGAVRRGRFPWARTPSRRPARPSR